MKTTRPAGIGRLGHGIPVLAAMALVSGVLAAVGPAAAVARPEATGAVRGGPAAGVISTVAGGVGGPGKATKVAITPCGVSLGAGGRLLIAADRSVRQVIPGTDRLTTPAGTGDTGPPGDGGTATSANLSTCGAALDHSGNLVIADYAHSRIQVVAHRTGTFYGQPMTAGDIYIIAGNGTSGFSGDGGPATSAALSRPQDVTVDGAGNLVIADTINFRIRVVAHRTGTFYGQPMTAGDIYTIAGNGTGGFSGDGGPATSAELNLPTGTTVDGGGNVLIADRTNFRIRVVAHRTGTFYGQPMTAGDIYTIAGNGTGGFSGDGGPATSAELNLPTGTTVDAAGNALIADAGNNRIRVVAAATGTFYGQPMTARHIYTIAGNGTGGFSGDGGPATTATLSFPESVAVDAAGNLLISDGGNHRVRVVPAATGTFYGQPMTAGHIYTIAGNGHGEFSGDGGPAARAQFLGPQGVAVDASGNLLIADTSNGRARVIAAAAGMFYGQAMTAGDIYTIAGNGRRQGFSGDGGPATSARLSLPQGVAADAAGNLLIADTFNDRVRVVAAHTGTFYGQAMTARDIYTVAGGGTGGLGDGGPATSAELSRPQDVTVDGTGNLLIADIDNNRVRVVAARTGTFYGQAMTAGDIYTVAGNGTQGFSGDGGPATSAELSFPEGAVIDAAGNVLVSDSRNNRVRVVAATTGTFYGQAMTAGNIYTIAGNGHSGFSGDGGPATTAELSRPQDLTVDGSGNLVIADLDNGRVRVVAATTGTFYGQAMTAGDIYTVAGNGHSGFSGDGGPATRAELRGPTALTVDPAGKLLIADSDNNRIRMVTG